MTLGNHGIQSHFCTSIIKHDMLKGPKVDQLPILLKKHGLAYQKFFPTSLCEMVVALSLFISIIKEHWAQ